MLANAAVNTDDVQELHFCIEGEERSKQIHMQMGRAIQKKRGVPEVDPGQLLEAVTIVYGWAEAEKDEVEDFDWIEAEELFDVLGIIRRSLDVEPMTAVALFQRSLALFSFCSDAHLSETYFDRGFPGRELCVAASKAPVLNQASLEQGEISPYFDADELKAAFRAALN